MVNGNIICIVNLDVYIVDISIYKVDAELDTIINQPDKLKEPTKLVEPYDQAILVEEAVKKDQQLHDYDTFIV